MREALHSTPNDRRVADRRVRRFSLVLHERRSGFDRRASASSGSATRSLDGVTAGLRDHPGILWIVLVMVNVLNLADFGLTLNVLALGGGEANPVMGALFSAHPVYAGLFKFLAVLATTLIVWRCRRFRSALHAALIMIAVFGLIFLYHIAGLTMFS